MNLAGKAITVITGIGLLLVVFAAISAATGAEAPSPYQLVKSNVVVNQGCSGTFISQKNQLVLTAKHCVTDQYRIIEEDVFADDGEVKKKKVRKFVPGTVTIPRYQGNKIVSEQIVRTTVVKLSDKSDLALLKMNFPSFDLKEATVACTEPLLGDPVTVVGNPMGILVNSVNTGVVSSVTRTNGDIGWEENRDDGLMQVSAGIVGGNSGGSVYNKAGELIGVPVLAHRANEVLGFAVPLESIHVFLKEANFPVCEANDG